MIVQQAQPGTAIFRAVFPDYVSPDLEVARLHMVWAVRLEVVMRAVAYGAGVDLSKVDLPSDWADLFAAPREMNEDAVLADMARVDALLARRYERLVSDGE